MSFGISAKEKANLKAKYKKGTKVELIRMDDIQAPPKGTKGVVVAVDDIGTIHVDWENGSSLGIVYGEDSCKIIEEAD